MPPVAPQPRTWIAGDFPLASRLRGDMANAVAFLTSRPTLVASRAATLALVASTLTLVGLDTESLDNRSGHVIPAATYAAQTAGLYLTEGSVEGAAISGGSMLCAFQASLNSVVTGRNGGQYPGSGHNAGVGGAWLVQLNPATNDTIALTAEVLGGASSLVNVQFKTEMVALPTTVGTPGVVVASPQPVAVWPPGSGTTLAGGPNYAVGTTSIVVSSNVGMVVGGSLGLNWLTGNPVTVAAETVTISSVAGTTIGISATKHAHVAGEPIAVPVSAAFMNQQVRDYINFLAYPPIAQLTTTSGTPGTLAVSTFPAGLPITMLAADVDNFGGWNAGVNPSRYTFPVSGVYYVYGQVYLAATANYTLCAGLRISGGQMDWGDTSTNPSAATALATSCTVRSLLRVTAGQYVELIGSQNLTGAIAILGTAGAHRRLTVVFRGF